MKIYRVGGSVRDTLLVRTPNDIDYLVVGSNPEEMLSLGYTQVGSHFPVFLHPETKQEYALARTEKATGVGHTDFECTTEGVTLEADLSRRDLTINAMAISLEDGTLHDPFGGRADLEAKLLRHVSDAFKEDPLRILRVARFAAQLNFGVAPETMNLMRAMVAKGALQAIPIERVKGEFDKAVMSENFEEFLSVLQSVGAMGTLEHAFKLEDFYHTRYIERKDDYELRIIKISLACIRSGSQSKPFPNRLLIGAKLHKFTEYIYSIRDIHTDIGGLLYKPQDILPYINQTLGEIKKFLGGYRTSWRFIPPQLEMLFVIHDEIKQLKFDSNMTVEEITSMKINAIVEYGQYLLWELETLGN